MKLLRSDLSASPSVNRLISISLHKNLPAIRYLTILFLSFASLASAQFGPGHDLGASSAYGDVFMAASDLDNDGDTDLLSASKIDHKIAWYENLGNDQYALQRII